MTTKHCETPWSRGSGSWSTPPQRDVSYRMCDRRKASRSRFADRILTKVNEAYPGIDVETEQDLAKEAFLRGCQNRSAAYAAAEKDPETLQDALEEVQNSVVNLKAFGRGSAVTRQISFAGREEKEEEDSGTEEEKVRKFFEKFMKERRSERSGPSRGRSAMRCYSCNGLGHMQRDCTEGPSC